MVDLSRRQVLKAGAAGAGAFVFAGKWPGAAASGQPLAGPSTGDLRLSYDEPAGSDWLRALPVGNGRLGAMVFGNVDTERFQLNEDTVWAGGPYDSSNRAGAAALPEIRRLVFADQWEAAQRLVDQAFLGKPAGQLAYQPVGNLRLTYATPGAVSEYRRDLDLETATSSASYVADGVRYRREVLASAPRPGHRGAAHRRHPQLDLVLGRVRQPAADDRLEPRPGHDRARRHLRRFRGRNRLHRLRDASRGGNARYTPKEGDLIELDGAARHVYRAMALQKVVLQAPAELAAGATAEVRLELRSLDSPVPRSTATLDVPAGWSAEPNRQELLPVGRNRSRVVTFNVTRGSAAAPGDVRLTGRIDGRGWTASAVAIVTAP